MNEMDFIAILLGIAGFVCVAFAVGFVIFLIFEDFFRRVFKMKKNNGSLGGFSAVSDDESSRKKD